MLEVRTRSGTGIPAERIAPEEYEEAIVKVLAGGGALQRPQLINEVRTLLGYLRTGATINEAVTSAIERILDAGMLGEASNGHRPEGKT